MNRQQQGRLRRRRITLYLSEPDYLNTLRTGHSDNIAAALHRIELMIQIRQILALFNISVTGAVAFVPVFDSNLGKYRHWYAKCAADQSVGTGTQFHGWNQST